MKRILSLLAALALAVSLPVPPALAADVANDILLSQRKPDNSGNIQRNIPAQNAITSASLPSFQEAIGLGLTDSPTFAGLTDSGLIAGRVVFAGTGGLLVDDADLTFVTDTLTFTKGVTTQLALGATTPGLITGTLGAITLTAAGTNQNVTFTPSGNSTGTFSAYLTHETPNFGSAKSLTLLGDFGANNYSLSYNVLAYGDGSANYGRLALNRARGTLASPAELVDGDLMGAFVARAWSNATWRPTAEIDFEVDGTVTATQRPPSRIVFYTNASNGAQVAQLKIDAAGNVNVTGNELQTDGGRVNYNLAAYGTGTVYTLTNTAAAVAFGTTSPSITLDKAGTYLIQGRIQMAYTGATVAAETATVKLRRTNNTAADLTSGSTVIDLPTSTALTHTYGVVDIPPVVYTTALTSDVITIFGNVSATLGAGTITAEIGGTNIVAIRLY